MQRPSKCNICDDGQQQNTDTGVGTGHRFVILHWKKQLAIVFFVVQACDSKVLLVSNYSEPIEE